MANVVQIIDNIPQNNIREIVVGGMSLRVTVFPRYELEKYIQYKESQAVGVYLLYNEVIGNAGIDYGVVYVGETENIAQRLKQHDAAMGKLFWTHTIVLQDRCNTLNKALCKYMEYILYTYLKNAHRAEVSNAVVPTKSVLSQADEIVADNIITMLRRICVSLNIRLLEPIGVGDFEENIDVYYMQYKGAIGMLRKITETKHYLLKGSICYYNTQIPQGYEHLLQLRDKLLKTKKARMNDNTSYFILLEDVEFDSEIEAASFVAMREITVPVESLWQCRKCL